MFEHINWMNYEQLNLTILSDYDMRSSPDDGDTRDDGEESVDYQTQTIYHHRSELPICFNSCSLIICLQLQSINSMSSYNQLIIETLSVMTRISLRIKRSSFCRGPLDLPSSRTAGLLGDLTEYAEFTSLAITRCFIYLLKQPFDGRGPLV